MYYVYVIESEKYHRYYIGQTEELEARVERHNKGRNRSTKAFAPWRLKWWKEFETRSGAVRMEMQLKAIKKRSGLERFISEDNFRGIAQSG